MKKNYLMIPINDIKKEPNNGDAHYAEIQFTNEPSVYDKKNWKYFVEVKVMSKERRNLSDFYTSKKLEQNILSTHPVVLEMVAALEIYEAAYGKKRAERALEAYRKSIK